jgi:hypothetical protein
VGRAALPRTGDLRMSDGPTAYIPPNQRAGMRRLVNNNRRLMGLPPQPEPTCTCPRDDPWQRDCPVHGDAEPEESTDD